MPPPTAASPNRRRRDEATSADELGLLRCHWIRLPSDELPDGADPWVLIPGCWAALSHPDGGCECDTLTYRMALQVEQRRNVDATIRHLRHRCRQWSVAADAAWSSLTGRPALGGALHPAELADAARTAPIWWQDESNTHSRRF